jgi:anthranilate phosphoribosyltransferase
MIPKALIEQVHSGVHLERAQMQSVIESMLAGQVDDDTTRELLLALRAKGESIDELAGAALAMRKHMTPIHSKRVGLLDTCGTGGDGAKTFNISTAAALVAAAAGVPVAKHGNRKITSATGSADVLSQLGIRIEASREVVERCLDDLGICFCFAPLLHPAMKHVANVRRSLGVPTLFNYLGPLCNPANADFQVLGVGNAELQHKIAYVLSQLPVRHAIVVRGMDGMDEVSLAAETVVLEVSNSSVTELRWTPEIFGLKPIDPKHLLVETPEQSAAVIRSVLSGAKGACRDTVLANAAAGLWVAGLEQDLKSAVARCAAAIDSGEAKVLVDRLSAMSNLASE